MSYINSSCAAILSVVVGMSSAYAVAPKDKVFVGIDVQAVNLTLDSDLERWTMNGSTSFIENSLSGASLFGGYRWQKWAFEIGVTGISEVTYTGTARSGTTSVLNVSLKQKNYNAYLDALYFYPVGENFEIKGLVGLGVLTTEFDGNMSVTDSGFISSTSGNSQESAGNLRLGLGAQYNFSCHWSSSLMYKYQWGNDYFSGMQAIALGVAYSF